MNQLSTKKFIIASLLCAPFFFVACGDDITEEIEKSEIKTEENGGRWARPERQLVVTMSQTDENATRVVLVDGKYTTPKSSGVKATWETTDKVGVWNSTAFAKGQNGYNTVSPNSNTQYTNFVGTVNCSKGDKISLFYPYGNGTGVTTSSDGMLTLNLQSQNGTLEEISKKFDLVYGEATISSVSNGEASASLGTLTSGITILELQFQDKDNGNEQIEFDHLEIQVEGGHNMATLNLNKIADGLTMTGGNTFDIRPGKLVDKVYVALFGETAGKTLRFSIIDQYGFQHQASAKAPGTVTAGQITRANLKAKDGKFIEFDDTKFAKGNLMWDNGSIATSSATGRWLYESHLTYDCWFIAPSQEWSPEQLNGTSVTGTIAVWPAAVYKHDAGKDTIYTVPSPSTQNYYYSTFVTACAGLHAATPWNGLNVVEGRDVSTGGTNAAFLSGSFSNVYYQGKLYANSYLDGGYNLEDALKWTTGPVDGTVNKTRYFFGDQAYLVSKGEYVMPTEKDLAKIFEHSNACWGVIFIPDGSNIAMQNGVKTDDGKLPIYGLYVNKMRTRADMESANGMFVGKENTGRLLDANKEIGYKGMAVVLTKKDLKEGIFLPAEGMRNASLSSGVTYISTCLPGEYCSYLTALVSGNFGSKIGRHYMARAINNGKYRNYGEDNAADVKVGLSNEIRTRSGSIRPVFVGDIFK